MAILNIGQKNLNDRDSNPNKIIENRLNNNTCFAKFFVFEMDIGIEF